MSNYNDDIKNCLETLNKGGLILYPTDTIWGIGCDATNKNAIEKIYRLKKRPDKKAMIILMADKKDISNYVEEPDERVFEHLNNTAKPTTVIYNKAKNLPGNLINSDGSIAIRIIKDDFCKELLLQFKKPIVSTSANISGETFPRDYHAIATEIKNGVDYIVQHRRHDSMSLQPSSIIKLNSDGKIEVIR